MDIFDLKFRFLNIRPSSYSWLFPPVIDITKLDKLADNNNFPVFENLIPALYFAAILSIFRYFLKILIVKPLAIYLLKLKIVSKLSVFLKNKLFLVKTV